MNLIHNKPDLAFCTPAGGSPIGMYKILVEKAENKEVDFSKMKVCNMDEYVGLDKMHDQSYNYFVRHHFLNHVVYDQENSAFINALAKDKELECKRYNSALDRLDLDLAISGIGLSGHVAFNEPDNSLISRTHVVDLHQDTIEANARFFEKISDVPKQAYSIGIADLMMSKNLLIVASGKNKAEVVSRLFSDSLVSTQFPVSFIKMHSNCVVIMDKDASSLLDLKGLAKRTIQLEVVHYDI
jgi:glucosamine-6-phosphate deaminase